MVRRPSPDVEYQSFRGTTMTPTTSVLVFENGAVLNCLDAQSVREYHPKATLMVTSTIDLLVAARAASVDGTIYGLVSRLLSQQVAESLSPRNALYNNPHEWLSALRRVARIPAGCKKRGADRMNTAAPQAPAVEPVAKKPAGPKFTQKSLAGKVIHLLVKENPKRPNTKAFDIFQLYFTHAPLTVEKFFELGGRMSDVKCDVEKGYASLKDA